MKNQHPKLDKINDNDNNPSVSACENHRHVVIGTINVGNTYHMLKRLEKICNKRQTHLITGSPNRYPK